MFELAVLLAAFAGFGLFRPRWSSLCVGVVPAVLAFVWLLVHEDYPPGVPGADLSAADVAWYFGMSALVGCVSALACAVGVIGGGALRKRPARSLL